MFLKIIRSEFPLLQNCDIWSLSCDFSDRGPDPSDVIRSMLTQSVRAGLSPCLHILKPLPASSLVSVPCSGPAQSTDVSFVSSDISDSISLINPIIHPASF